MFLGIDATSVLANEEANANKGQSVIDVDSDDDVGDVSKVIEDIREHSILNFLICSLNFDHIYMGLFFFICAASIFLAIDSPLCIESQIWL